MDPETWWRHEMENISTLLALCARNSPVTGEFPSQRPATRSFDAFFDLRLNKRLSKHSWGLWFETPSRSLWRQCNGSVRHYADGAVYIFSVDMFIQVCLVFVVGCPVDNKSTLVLVHYITDKTLQWRHDGCDCVSNHLAQDRLLIHLFRRRSKETSKLRVTSLCEGNSPVNRVVKKVSIDEWHENIYELVKKLRKIYAAFT